MLYTTTMVFFSIDAVNFIVTHMSQWPSSSKNLYCQVCEIREADQPRLLSLGDLAHAQMLVFLGSRAGAIFWARREKTAAILSVVQSVHLQSDVSGERILSCTI